MIGRTVKTPAVTTWMARACLNTHPHGAIMGLDDRVAALESRLDRDDAEFRQFRDELRKNLAHQTRDIQVIATGMSSITGAAKVLGAFVAVFVAVVGLVVSIQLGI